MARIATLLLALGAGLLAGACAAPAPEAGQARPFDPALDCADADAIDDARCEPYLRKR
jgi:hypothetical protein